MNEDKVAEQIKQYTELAKDNKNIDVAALAMNAFQQQAQNMLSPKEKRIAYFVSIGLPPLGLIFAAKFWLSEKEDGNSAAIWCIVLTVVSILLFLGIMQILIGSTGMTYQQFQQAPGQLQQLLQ